MIEFKDIVLHFVLRIYYMYVITISASNCDFPILKKEILRIPVVNIHIIGKSIQNFVFPVCDGRLAKDIFLLTKLIPIGLKLIYELLLKF